MTSTDQPDPYAVEKGAGKPAASSGAGTSECFSVQMRDGVHVIRFSRGDVLDAYYIKQLGEDLVTYVRANENPKLIVDMTSVNHLSSAALGMLVTLKSNVDVASGRLCLCGIQHDLMKIFTLTKLHKVLEIHETVDNAMSSLA